jgi:hypothetical protein
MLCPNSSIKFMFTMLQPIVIYTWIFLFHYNYFNLRFVGFYSSRPAGERSWNSSLWPWKCSGWPCSSWCCARPALGGAITTLGWFSVTVGSPFMNFLKILKLVLWNGNAWELTKHFKESFHITLLKPNTLRFTFEIVVVDDLLELFKLGMRIDEQGVDGGEVEDSARGLGLPAHQLHPLAEVLLWINHLWPRLITESITT